ncbi:MAG: glutaminyl-peptide cyclotransferase [Deferribacterota bacterium]|nr:glutaminyl-peptide cyclotransferase [Deferribacterota bacterium]
MKNIINFIIIIFLFNLNLVYSSNNGSKNEKIFTYEIVKKYPHDVNNFTEGFVYEDGIIYESTGKYGSTYIKKYKLGSNEYIKTYKLPLMYFGEGATILKDKIYQLTWKSRIGFIYNKKDLKFLGNFKYNSRGWGLTTDGEYLIMSDGTNKLHFIDPKTFKEERVLEVFDNNDVPIVNINELEYIDGKIYGNIFLTDLIVIISPDNGGVEGWINLEGILEDVELEEPVDVLNGIAYDDKKKRLFVTGKLWPYIFEIKLLPLDDNN